MQSISPSKGTAAGNTRSHGNAEGAATLPLWTLEKLAYQNKQNACMRLYARREECFLLQRETLATVATVPVTLSLPLVAGRLGRPSRPIVTSRQ